MVRPSRSCHDRTRRAQPGGVGRSPNGSPVYPCSCPSRSIAAGERPDAYVSSRFQPECPGVAPHDGVPIPVVRLDHRRLLYARPEESPLSRPTRLLGVCYERRSGHCLITNRRGNRSRIVTRNSRPIHVHHFTRHIGMGHQYQEMISTTSPDVPTRFPAK